MNQEYKQGLFQYLKYGTSPFHVIKNSVDLLTEAGFEQLDFDKDWQLKNGGSYMVQYRGTTLFAFTVGAAFEAAQGMRIVASHIDSPCPRVKPHAEMNEQGYQKLNVEMYGGAILSTWMDRPLSVAGKVALKSNNPFKPEVRLIDLKEPVLIIPNLAIHLNRDMNKGVELNKQTDMLPIVGMDIDKETPDFLLDALAESLQVSKEDVLDYELSVYNVDEPQCVGLHREFISAPRLDDLVAVYASVTGIVEAQSRTEGINMIALFDHEEIGSRTKQGAASNIFTYVIEKIYGSFGRERKDLFPSIANSMMLSMDVAHGLHPNQTGKYDVTNKPVLGGGICLKEASGQSYATDCEAIAVVQQLCHVRGIAYQKSVNRSDVTGGSTLGAIVGALLPMPIVDCGVPLLAMHSARELMGAADQEAAQALVNAFFEV